MFDTNALISQTTQAQGSLYVAQPDEGDYRMVIDNSTPISEWMREVEVTDKHTGEKTPRPILRVPFLVQDPAVTKKLGREKVLVSMDIWLDLTPDGRLDLETEGRNTKLHRLRAAVGQNKAGASWNLGMLPGAGPLMGHVTKRPNPKDADNPFTEVDRVVPIA